MQEARQAYIMAQETKLAAAAPETQPLSSELQALADKLSSQAADAVPFVRITDRQEQILALTPPQKNN